MNGVMFTSMEAAVIANTERSGACPQRSEDSRLGTPLVALPAINFGGYAGACTTSVPVGNTGTRGQLLQGWAYE